MKQLVLSLIFSALLIPFGKSQTIMTADAKRIHAEWMNLVYNITQNTVGFSPPVSARAYAYLNIGIYEAMLPSLNGYQSLSGQLQDFERKTATNFDKLNYVLVCNRTFYQLVSYLYRNMPDEYRKINNEFYEKNKKAYSKNINKKISKKSEAYADAIAAEIINWSKSDAADNGFNSNFPDTYKAPKCDSCWVQTFPGYFQALQPYWGKNRLFIQSNGQLSADIPYFNYSTDTNSVLYKDALEIYKLNVDKEKEKIAEYWDDAPGYSGTPSGHFFSIAMQLSKEKNLILADILSINAALGVAINDAMIETWRLKYQYNLLRPITYIERHIGKGFNTTIPTPAFPEFPSGHSYQSGAGTDVLKHFLGDNLSFTDNTHSSRIDIDGRPRKFNNFTEMSEEISISRFYGGIHYRSTLSTSLIFGRKIGQNTVQRLKFKY
jgi:hypothetical protein